VYAVSNFSKPDLQVIVKDAKAERDESDGLVSAIQSEITSSFSGNTTRRGKFLLTVDMIEHRSYFTYGNWNAVTDCAGKCNAPSPQFGLSTLTEVRLKLLLP
jgi:hypothetical protein